MSNLSRYKKWIHWKCDEMQYKYIMFTQVVISYCQKCWSKTRATRTIIRTKPDYFSLIFGSFMWKTLWKKKYISFLFSSPVSFGLLVLQSFVKKSLKGVIKSKIERLHKNFSRPSNYINMSNSRNPSLMFTSIFDDRKNRLPVSQM